LIRKGGEGLANEEYNPQLDTNRWFSKKRQILNFAYSHWHRPTAKDDIDKMNSPCCHWIKYFCLYKIVINTPFEYRVYFLHTIWIQSIFFMHHLNIEYIFYNDCCIWKMEVFLRRTEIITWPPKFWNGS
jgi:hypothetical protein